MSGIVIPESTEQIIKDSTFHFGGTFRWVSARSVRTPEKHLMISRDDKEITVVTNDLDDVDIIAINPDTWLFIPIDCSQPFYCVGFIAKLSTMLSAAGIDILVLSAFLTRLGVRESRGWGTGGGGPAKGGIQGGAGVNHGDVCSFPLPAAALSRRGEG